MNEALKTSPPATSPDSPSAISLPASEYGHTPCDRPAGMTSGPSGLEAAPASLSAKRARAMGLLTSGTFGPPSSTSSPNADLSLSLASRLKQQLSTAGSTLYKLTWKESVTPQGRRVSVLRAAVPRTSGRDSTLLEPRHWPAPTTPSGGQKPPEGTTATGRTPDGRKVQVTLQNVALMVAGWVTPTCTDAVRGVKAPRPHDTGIPLTQQVGLLDFGETSSGSPSEIPKSARLNPALSRWLMGLPPEWDQEAPLKG